MTYKSGSGKSKVDFMIRRKDGQKLVGCKVILGKAVVSKQRLAVADFKWKPGREKPEKKRPRKLKVWKLKDKQAEFKEEVKLR